MPNPLDILDKIEIAFLSDETVPIDVAMAFLSILSPRGQMIAMGSALQVVLNLEEASCLPTTDSLPIA